MKNHLIRQFFIKTRRDSPRSTLQCGNLYQSIELDELYPMIIFSFSKSGSIELKLAKNHLICQFFIKTRRDSPRSTLQCGELYQSIDLDKLYPTNTILISKLIFIQLKIPKNLKKMPKIKRTFVKCERIRLDALSNVETYVNR